MGENQYKIIFLAQSLEQPRIVKRVIEYSKRYEKVHVYGFKRRIHEVGNYKKFEQYKNIELHFKGSIENNNYLSRLKLYFLLLVSIYWEHGLNRKNLYVFGMDLRLLSVFILNANTYYEISDIIWLYKKPFVRKILGAIDRMLARNSEKVFFTSRGFYEKYYKRQLPESRVDFLENKFQSFNKVKPLDSLISDRLRIAYIGAFRYPSIILNLLKIVKQNPDIVLNIYGDGLQDIVREMKEYATACPNINFHGPFKNPDDLQDIYSENNLNFVVYDNVLLNERVAMPNKYYESGFFNMPIVCATNTYVGDRAKSQGMGWTINTDMRSMEEFLTSVSMEDLRNKHEKIKELDKSLFQYQN